MAWMMITGATIVASLIATLMLTEWVVWRGRTREGLKWAENVPRRPTRIDGL